MAVVKCPAQFNMLFPFSRTGVKSVLVSLMAQRAEIKFDPAYILPSQIASAITELGYPSKVNEAEGLGQGVLDLAVGDQKGFVAKSLNSTLLGHSLPEEKHTHKNTKKKNNNKPQNPLILYEDFCS